MKKTDQERLDAIHRLPCLACVQVGCQQPSRTEAHHLVDRGTRKHSGGHLATIPLCGWHHRSEPLSDHSMRYMQSVYGPSLALASKHFAVVFGTQRELLARTNAVIK